ncbi:hypothetical protein 32HC_75 [Mycobacterium phage 32HC]|uniref:Uncharacterized protein n=1 Tax=Mycobacterium phage 32HC TaxID=1445729 RepID=W8EAG7_9CAUD|nr:hypothetical protein ST32HC_75 [Mycobacterium phage 32HC]AHJ86353.1 hypothetical protein 32HC_75 [Mycobacterium phage 32HC]
MTTALQTDVLVRAWDKQLGSEGARFKAVLSRQDVEIHLGYVAGEPASRRISRPGLVVIAPSGTPAGQNAVDVTVCAIPDAIKLTILSTPELLWQPINAHRDLLLNWRIECIPFTEWLRLRLGDTDPATARPDDGR